MCSQVTFATIDDSAAVVWDVTEGGQSDVNVTSNSTLHFSWSGFVETVSGIEYCESVVATTPHIRSNRTLMWQRQDGVLATHQVNVSDGTTCYGFIRCWSRAGDAAIARSDGVLVDLSVSAGALCDAMCSLGIDCAYVSGPETRRSVG